ncbi:MAG: hypothetical protein HN417_11950 [Desulfobacula sp.]|nr:hypothetical protein [Desulfobacula sp.]
MLEEVLNNDPQQLDEFNKAGVGLKKTLLRHHKMSLFAENVFREFAQKAKQPILLNKGEFYRLTDFVPKEEFSSEIIEKLDLIKEYLEFRQENEL